MAASGPRPKTPLGPGRILQIIQVSCRSFRGQRPQRTLVSNKQILLLPIPEHPIVNLRLKRPDTLMRYVPPVTSEDVDRLSCPNRQSAYLDIASVASGHIQEGGDTWEPCDRDIGVDA